MSTKLELLKEVEKSFYILEMSDDWDEDGAKVISPEVFNKALLLAHFLISEVEGLDIFDINPCRDGSVDICFKNEKTKYRLLINITINHFKYYGDNGNDKDVIKRGVNLLSEERNKKDLIKWCREFMVS